MRGCQLTAFLTAAPQGRAVLPVLPYALLLQSLPISPPYHSQTSLKSCLQAPLYFRTSHSLLARPSLPLSSPLQ